MNATAMLPGLPEIADQPVTRTAAAELPAHVKPGRWWRNARSDDRGTWHLPAGRGEFVDAICGAFVPAASRSTERWFAEGDEPAAACKRCLRIIQARDAADARSDATDDDNGTNDHDEHGAAA